MIQLQRNERDREARTNRILDFSRSGLESRRFGESLHRTAGRGNQVFGQETPKGLIALSHHSRQDQEIMQAPSLFPHCIFMRGVREPLRNGSRTLAGWRFGVLGAARVTPVTIWAAWTSKEIGSWSIFARRFPDGGLFETEMASEDNLISW